MRLPHDVTNCPNCGAPLPASGLCKYCGTEVYRDDAGRINFRVVNCNVYPVTAKIRLNKSIVDYVADPGCFGKYINRLLAEKLVEELMNQADIQQEYDPRTDELCVRARILVADGKRYMRYITEDNE